MIRRLRRHPVLLTAWLSARSGLRRVIPSRTVAAVTTIAALLVVSLVGWIGAATLREPAVRLIAFIAQYGFALAGLAGAHAMVLVSGLRRRLIDGYVNSWLIAAPIPAGSVRLALAMRTVIAAGLNLAAILLLLAGIAWIADEAARAAPLIALITGGFIAGCLLGWLLPRRQRSAFEASRYVPKSRGNAGLLSSSSQGLSHWPIAQVFAWHRPENSRVVLLAALFTVQGGSSIVTGLCVVGAWLLAIYLASLLQATLRVGRDAAVWLRSAPITFIAFAWPIARRALLHQTIGTLIVAVVILILGSPPAMALYLAGLWLSVVVFATAVSLADSYCSRRSALKLAFSAAGFAAIEAREQCWAIPFAFAFAVWHVRRALRSQGASS